MKNVLILGASGQIARWVVGFLAKKKGVHLTLFVRDPKKLEDAPASSRIIRGDVLNNKDIQAAIAGQDVVYANLTGDDLDEQARHIIAAMQAADVRRLIFVVSLGIYDEVPGKFGKWNKRMIGEALRQQLVRSCGSCATHGCLDCTCGHRRGSGAAGEGAV